MNTTNSRIATPARRREMSVLAHLRALVPQRPLTFSEAVRLTELQANSLRRLLGVTTPDLPEGAITSLPRIEVVEVVDLPSSGASQWSDGRWVIAINGLEPWQRQRFSIGHELWHVINHQTSERLCTPTRFSSTCATAEKLADYFSGCLYMPKGHLKRLVGEGLNTEDLADTFGVSKPAVGVRLSQIGMTDRRRCGQSRTATSGARYRPPGRAHSTTSTPLTNRSVSATTKRR